MTNRRIRQPRQLRQSKGQKGYSLVELIIALTVAVILLLLLFNTFQNNTQLARTQIDVADMQQSQRVVQHEMSRLIRMTGRGGLAHMVDRGNGTRFLPALTVRNNVAAGENVVVGDASSPLVTEGTDVLTIRGVFNSPVYQLNFANPATLMLTNNGNPTTDATQATEGTLLITDPSPTGVPQDLSVFCNPNDPTGEAMVIVSPIDEAIYAVVEISGANCFGGQATVTFDVSGGTNTNAFGTLYNSGLSGTPTLPSGLSNAAYAGIVDEYRFYVREPDPNTLPAPTLSIARLIPGTEIAHNEGVDLDLADNILDLQIALGYDSSLGAGLADRNGDGFTNEDDIVVTETGNGQDDDWLFNSDQDDPNAAPFIPPWDDDPLSGAPPQPEIYYLRLTTLARVQVPDRTYDSLQITRIEDRDVDPLNQLDERRFRRQLIQTTIDLRNL